MKTFVYKQTQTFYLHVDADTQEAADAIADEVNIYEDTVFATELLTELSGWELTEVMFTEQGMQDDNCASMEL